MPGPLRDRGLLDALNSGVLVPRYGRGAPSPTPRARPPFPTPFPAVPFPPPPVELTMLSSWDRPIRKVLLTIPNTVFGEEGNTDPVRMRLEAAYRSLFRSLPADCRLVVLVKPKHHATAHVWLADEGVHSNRYEILPMTKANATMWANDPFWTCTPRTRPLDPPVLVEPNTYPRVGDKHVADDLIDALGYSGIVLPRLFEAGNLLVGDDFYFVGIDTVDDLGPGTLAVGKAYRAMEAVRRPIVVGDPTTSLLPVEWSEPLAGLTPWKVSGPELKEGSRQPIFHLDMYVTLVGRTEPEAPFVVMVGDPAMATDLMGGSTWVPGLGQDPTRQLEFDAVANQLTDAGFEVIRNPLPLVYEDSTSSTTRKYYFASYNNAIVQRNPDRVLLPSYVDASSQELKAVEAHQILQWEKLGFEVILLADMNAFALAGGAANCIKNVLARGFDPMQ